MRQIPGIRRLPHVGTSRSSIERDVDEEMHFHIQMRIEDLMRQGQSEADAKATATREYGDISLARHELASIDRRSARQASWRETLASVGQDIRFALRGLGTRPGFTATVLLTIALGVGANAAIFSVVDSVLLRPLPFTQPDRLVHLWETFHSNVDNRSEASYPDYLDWRARSKTFTDLAGYHGGGFLFGGSQPATVSGAKSTANFFDVLGVRPLVGRTFSAGEDAIGAPKVVLLSYGFWQRQFGGDRAVVGRAVTLDGTAATIIGVLPESFQFARQGGAQIWVPIDRGKVQREQRGNHWLNVVARLKPNATAATAAQDLSAIMRDLAKVYPPSNAGRDGLIVPLQQELVGSVKPILLLLYGAVVVVLLVACVNVANLLLIRGADRQREIAVRVALGAGKARLVRQLLTESLLLAVFGGLLGLGVAQAGLRALVGLIPAQQIRGIPQLATVGLDPRIVAYALLLSLLAGLGFGIIPALRMTKPALYDALKNAGRGSIGGASRLRDGLVVGEIALTVILLSGALLFGRSLMRLLAIDPGFRAEHVVTTNVVLPRANYRDAASQVDFFRRFTDRLRETPGMQSVGLTTKLPLDFGNSMGFYIASQPVPAPGQLPNASYREVSTDYFRTLGIPVTSGRTFGAGDDATAARVAVVNRAFVTAYFKNQDPIGQVLTTGSDSFHVVGVVGDVTIGKLEDKIPPTLYLPFAQNAEPVMTVVVRTTATVEQPSRGIREVVASLDPSAALSQVTSMDDLVTASASVFMRRFPLYLVGAFALTALLLAIVGIYGVVSYSVAQRTREMGIRLALGAEPKSLVALVLWHGGVMAAAGIVVGVGGALALGRFAATMLYGVRPSDPLTYASVALVLAVVAVCATIVPARRATRVDPALALRSD
ncbi:MAG: permease [Gemmatimonadetes bacterium]|nr:permease [Gemmatimonadota bacterium]